LAKSPAIGKTLLFDEYNGSLRSDAVLGISGGLFPAIRMLMPCAISMIKRFYLELGLLRDEHLRATERKSSRRSVAIQRLQLSSRTCKKAGGKGIRPDRPAYEEFLRKAAGGISIYSP